MNQPSINPTPDTTPGGTPDTTPGGTGGLSASVSAPHVIVIAQHTGPQHTSPQHTSPQPPIRSGNVAKLAHPKPSARRNRRALRPPAVVTAQTISFVLALLLLAPPSITIGQSETEVVTTVKKLAEDLASGNLELKRDAAYALAKLGSKAEPALKTLIETLDSERDSQVWVQISMAIARIGPASFEAIPVLLEHLGNRDEQRRFRAAYALGRIGAVAIPDLKKSLKSRSSTVRASAASALSQMGPAASAAIPDLVHALSDSEALVRDNAANALQNIGSRALPALLQAAGSSNTTQSAAAIRVLGHIGKFTDDARAILNSASNSDDATVRAAALSALFVSGLAPKQSETLLRRALTDSADDVRSAGLLELRRRKRAARDILPLLMELLESDRREVARTAAIGIGILGSAAESSVPALIRRLQQQTDDDPTMIRAIVRIGPPAVPHLLSVDDLPESNGLVEKALAQVGPLATDALVAAMKNSNENVRLRAIRSLGRMEGLGAETFSSIVARLQDPDPRIREAAAQSIGQADQLQRDNDAFLALTKAAADPDPSVRRAAIISMSRAASQGVRQAVLRKVVTTALNDADARVRRGGMAAIAGSPEIAVRFVEQLVTGLQDQHPDVREDAATALANVDAKQLKESDSFDPVAAALVNALTDESDEVKTRAAEAIGRTKAVNDDTVMTLSRLLVISNPSVVRPAIEALAELGSASESAVASVMKLDAHPKAEIRAAVANALPDISPDPKRVLPPLLTLLQDKDWSVRREAAHSLGDVGPPAAGAIPALFRMLEVEDDKEFARSALREIDTANADAVPILIEGLKSGDRRRVYYAVHLLAKIGPDARDALPHLKNAKKASDSSRLRGMVDRAIKSIDVVTDDSSSETE